MKAITRHIDYLLTCNDRVAIPGLGTVEAFGTPARYDEQASMWFPPVRAFAFNPSADSDDGLLARSIARRDDVSVAEAARIIADDVARALKTLQADGRVSLGHVGSLGSAADGSLTFTHADVSWLSPAYMWLPQVAVSPVETAADALKAADERAQRVRLWPTLLRRAGSAAACVAVIFALAWALTSNLRNAPAEQFASVGPAPARAESMLPQPGKADAPLILVVNRHADAVVDVEPRPDVTENRPGYYLIVASLPTVDEARKFAAQYPSMHLGVLEMDGRYRVFAARAESEAHAYAAASDPAIKSVFPASWVCRK